MPVTAFMRITSWPFIFKQLTATTHAAGTVRSRRTPIHIGLQQRSPLLSNMCLDAILRLRLPHMSRGISEIWTEIV
jgi:hypothetical protein